MDELRSLDKRIYLSPPHLNEEALVYLTEAVHSNWIAPVGPYVDAFERDLSTMLGVDQVLATNSGTSAIHLGLLALNVGAGDEVMCPTFTFCATANPIIYCGATPVFVDSEQESWNMDPGLLDDAINDRIRKGKKPRAIIVVHLYGMPAKMDELCQISREYNIPVLEDAAEAFGSLYNDKPAGTTGNAGVLSFNGNKIITTSSGGALFSSDENVIKKARYLRQEAREPLSCYEHKAVGYNYRLSNLLAAVGCAQLKVLHDRVIRRRRIFEYYRAELGGVCGIRFQAEGAGMFSNRWLTTMIVERGDPAVLQAALEAENIESRRLWKPMHLQPVFKDAPRFVNGVSEGAFREGLCLPSGSNLSEEDLARVVAIVRKTVNG